MPASIHASTSPPPLCPDRTTPPGFRLRLSGQSSAGTSPSASSMYLLSSNVVGFGQNPAPLVPWGRMAIIGRALASSCWPIRATETSSGSPVPSFPRPRPPGEKPWRWKSTSTVSTLAGSAFGIMTTARPAVTPPAASGVMSDTGPHLPVSGSSTCSFASS